MDPDLALLQLREAIAEARKAALGDSNDDEIQAWQDAGELMSTLDEWLTTGGFLPVEWQR